MKIIKEKVEIEQEYYKISKEDFDKKLKESYNSGYNDGLKKFVDTLCESFNEYPYRLNWGGLAKWAVEVKNACFKRSNIICRRDLYL